MVTMKFNLAERILEWREQFPEDQRPSQVEMAHMFGINPTTMTHYINGRSQRPDLEVVARICKGIGITDMNSVFEVVSLENEQ